MINGEGRRRSAAAPPAPPGGSHHSAFEVGTIWDSAFFFLVRKMRVPHPLVGTLNSPVEAAQKALTAAG